MSALGCCCGGGGVSLPLPYNTIDLIESTPYPLYLLAPRAAAAW